jgi:hypothetical protein
LSSRAFSHEGHHHGSHTQEAKAGQHEPSVQNIYDQIQENYLKDVKPIFVQKCAACHSSTNLAPWYEKVPIVGHIVESDRTEAKEHIEISKGFPFAGHGTNEEDLKAIEDSIKDSSMPPTLYKVFHPSSRLTDEEKKLILTWIQESIEKLKTLESSKNHNHE